MTEKTATGMFMIRMDPATRAALELLAKAHDRRMAAEVRVLVREAVKTLEGDRHGEIQQMETRG